MPWEQVNNALTKLADGKEHWLKGTRYIPSFYNEPAYIDLLVRLVEEKIAQDLAAAHLPSQIGIVLMNHGCPHKAKGFTSGIDESQVLYEQVREKLIHRYSLISVGWLNHDTPLIEWTQPNATLAAQNLIALGATTVIFMPIGFATENHETLLDVEHIIVNLRRKHRNITYVQMPCVNDHPEFLQTAADWADEHIAALLSEQARPVNLDQLAAAQAKAFHSYGHSHSHEHGHGHPNHHH